MTDNSFTETDLRNQLRNSESSLDQTTLGALATARKTALGARNKWYQEYRGSFSAGLVTAVLMIAVFMPFTNNDSSNIDIADENLQLLMEDPEFFLWVSQSYSSLPQ